MNADVESIIKETDVPLMEKLLSNLTFADLDAEDISKLGDAHFVKLFRLSQHSIEHLLHT